MQPPLGNQIHVDHAKIVSKDPSCRVLRDVRYPRGLYHSDRGLVRECVSNVSDVRFAMSLETRGTAIRFDQYFTSGCF